MVEDNICRDFLKGFCRFEGKCRFKHPDDKSRSGGGSGGGGVPLGDVCKDYARGHCDYGARCKFKHPVVCKDFISGKCTYPNCRFFHPPAPPSAGPPGGPFGGPMKRPMDPAFDDLPPQYCRDFVYDGVCRRPRCSFLHEMPNKRRPTGPGFDGPGPQGPGPVGPPGGPGWNGPGPDFVSPEVKAYVSQLELKLTMYEEKIKDLEKRCEQYEDFNKLLTERNDELKAKLGLGGGGSGGGGAYQGGSRGSEPRGYQAGRSSGGFQGNGSSGGYQSRENSSRGGGYY